MRQDHPRSRFITIYGRKPVLETLVDPTIAVEKVVIARQARGDIIESIIAAASDRSVRVMRADEAEVSRLSRQPNQDQGVVADVIAPRMETLARFLERHSRQDPLSLMALDQVTTPANVGMVIRSVVAAGLDGLILPHSGVSGLGPLVIKASAGTAFRCPLLLVADIGAALNLCSDAEVAIIGLEADALPSLFDHVPPRRAVYVIGGESDGLSAMTQSRLSGRLAIPMAPGSESLNVACAATLVAFELRRRSDNRLNPGLSEH
jgi:23S rRNA (guanosine2251-2'-O)-methyltransferase